jgi:aerobic carbon-monoxide dehydrogenase medium subunit
MQLPRSFEYHSPATVAEASRLLEEYGTSAAILAGGQSLIPLMKMRIVSPEHIVDIGRIKGLRSMELQDGVLVIGAMVRTGELARSELVRAKCQVLGECASQIADPLVRNMGTIGGNISHADPANDLPAVMVATGAEFVAEGTKGRRTFDARAFFLDMFTMAMAPGEILVEVRVPAREGTGSAYVKLERQAGDFGIVGAAAVLDLDESGLCTRAGIGLTGAGQSVVVARKAERAVTGRRIEREDVRAAAAAASAESEPLADLRGSTEYKRRMVEVATGRALESALKRARSSQR